jgi:RNA polymerase sigma-70 factor, ECF subfamily
LESDVLRCHEGSKDMQAVATYIESDQRVDVAQFENSMQQMQHALSRGLPSFYRRAYRLLGNTADAEDAVQDALLAAYKHLHQFRGQSQMSTWLHSIVANCARMQLRRRPRYAHVSFDSRIVEKQEYSLSETIPDHRPNPEEQCHNSEVNARLSMLAAQLSPTLQRTFQLRLIEDVSICETARILRVPVGTVKAQLSRARTKLKNSIRRTLKPRHRASHAPHRHQGL